MSGETTESSIGDDATRLATERQRAAARPDASVWVGASAGAGKTKVLTDRVQRLLLQGTEPSRILCLTYTKAAAAEMAERLRRNLAQWTTLDRSGLIEALRDLTGEEPNDERLDRARRLFATVLDAPVGVRLQTIHSFCQSVLGRFPLEAGVPPHFDLIETRRAAEIAIRARDDLLIASRRRPDDPVSRAVGSVIARVGEHGFGTLMDTVFRERSRLSAVTEPGSLSRLRERAGGEGLATLPNDPGADNHDEPPSPRPSPASGRGGEVEDRLSDVLGLAPGATGETVLASLGQPDAALRGLVERAGRSDKASDEAFVAGLAPWLEGEAIDDALLARLRRCLFTEKNERRKRLCTKAVMEDIANSNELVEALMDRVEDILGKLAAIETRDATLDLLVFADALLDRYAARKAEASGLDYDDLILATRRLLEATSAGWVRYKLDQGIDHVLVDEAQDTNPDQWEVIWALTEEFFVGEGADPRPRTVFAVGDPKQSIFSFQRADPRRFAEMRERFRQRVTEGGEAFEQVPFDVSFRSVQGVLDLVDTTFEGEAGIGVSEGAWSRHLASRGTLPATIELWPPAPPPPAIAVEDVWDPPREYDREVAAEIRLARVVAARIGTLIGERRDTLDRPICARDIMVLVRRRRTFGDELVRSLKKQGVPVAGVDRLKVPSHLAVRDLIALAESLILPEDDYSLACALKSPLLGLEDKDLEAIGADRGHVSLRSALRAKAGAEPGSVFAEADARLAAFARRLDRESPHAFFARLLGPDGGRRRIVGRLGHEAEDPLDEFLSLALAHAESEAGTMVEFLHCLQADDSEIRREMEQAERDEVRLITVHGAKGLQAPIVIVPDTMGLPNDRHQVPLYWIEDGETALPIWAPQKKEDRDPRSRHLVEAARERQLEEYRRLLYVALTRAEDRLIVCGWADKTAASPDCWYHLVEAAMQREGESFDFDLHALHEDGWSGAGWRWLAGEGAEPVPAAIEPDAAGALADPEDWMNRRPPEEPVPPRPLAPAAPVIQGAATSPLAMEGTVRRFRRGVLIHRLLESLPDTPPAGRRTAGMRYLAGAARELAAEDRERLLDEVMRVLDDPLFQPVFQPGSLAEVPLTGLVEGTAISAIVDRLVVTDADVMIVDYKSNRPAPSVVERTPAGYLVQLGRYAALARSIWPERTIRTALLWTDVPRLMPVPETLLRTGIDAIASIDGGGGAP